MAVFALGIYTVIHSMTITMEMLCIHVCMTSSWQSAFSFVLLNGFAELKISVFKKCDYLGLYEFSVNDSVEIFQLLLYIFCVILVTNQPLSTVMRVASLMLFTETCMDSIKHGFLTRLNKLDVKFY
jgi:hypothetical protein